MLAAPNTHEGSDHLPTAANEMPDIQSDATWLAAASRRLEADGFRITRDSSDANRQFTMVAHRSRFELTKFGNVETFFVFGSLERADQETVRKFGADAFACALRMKQFPLPRGLFEAVFCFPVCLTENLDEATIQHVRNETPPRHWSAAEIPVIYVRSTGQLVYYEKTAAWGAAYFAGFRKQIMKYLAGS